jgi:peptide/nickel transport system substrate-binding protein
MYTKTKLSSLAVHRKIIPLWCQIFICLLSSFLLFCGCEKKQIPNEQNREIIVGLQNMPKTLDPRFATDADGMRITGHLIFSSLVKLDYDLRIIPDCAEKWEMPDESTYVFHIRPNVFFHNGKQLTAKDVKFTFEHLMDSKTGSPFAATYNDKIKSIEIIDSLTVKFSLKAPMASFLTSIIMPVLPKEEVENKTFPGKKIGSGPFILVKQGPSNIKLEANPAYFGGKPKYKGLEFKAVSDDNTRFLKMKKGELDIIINGMPAARISDFTAQPLNSMYDVIEEPGVSYNYLAFNLNDKLMAKSAVRRAIAHGINIDEIIKYRLHGHAIRAKGLLSPVNWFFEPEVTVYDYNPEKARKILNRAGYRDPDKDGPKSRLTLEFKTSNNKQVIGIARIIKAQLADIGINVELKSFEWGTFYGDIKAGNFQMTSMRWVGFSEPDFYYDIFHSSQIPPSGRNRGRYKNNDIDHLTENARIGSDLEMRKSLYSVVQKIASEDLPYISLWHINNTTIINKKIKGYRQHPLAGFGSFADCQWDVN